ncbi:MAG: DNA-directed RNA polymerase subunit alpha [Planctomycetota bacterium]
MRKRWMGFELPVRVVCDKETLTDTYGKFTAEPFERGYGTTVGNGLRRVLLSSLRGAAIATVKFEGVQHQFQTIPGVVEDVTDVCLNLKKVLVKLHGDQPKELALDVQRKGEVTAGDIQHDADVEIANPDLHLATVSEGGKIVATMQARPGRGYHVAEEFETEDVGQIALDCIFSPVVKVKPLVENCRVGQVTDYDRLTLEIWTNGTVEPEMALVEAARVYRKHLDPFVQYFELGPPVEDAAAQLAAQKELEHRNELERRLAKPVDELDLSVRAANCLASQNIQNLRDLVTKTEQDLLNLRNFGQTSLQEVKDRLNEHDLELSMNLD